MAVRRANHYTKQAVITDANNIYKYDTYIIDIARFLSSHSLLFLTAHRDDRSWVKGFMAKNNTTFKLKDAKALVGMEKFVSKM